MGKTTRGECPVCRAERNAEILAEDSVAGTDGDSGIWHGSALAILRCSGCDSRYVRRATSCSEDADPETGIIEPEITYWPPTVRSCSRPRPRWLGSDILGFGFEADEPDIAAVLVEVYSAADADLRVLATMGMRTVFDRACDRLGVDPNLTFADKLKELAANGKISIEEKETLHTLVEAGNGAAHRGWKPNASEIDTLLHALENFLERAFVVKHEVRRLKNSIPSRQTVK